MAFQSVNPNVGIDDKAKTTVTVFAAQGRLVFRNLEKISVKCDVQFDADAQALGFKFVGQESTGYAVQTRNDVAIVKCLAVFKKCPWLADGRYELFYDKKDSMWKSQSFMARNL